MVNFENISFQDSASPIMEGIVDLHSYIIFFLIQIFLVVIVFFGSILYEFEYKIQAMTLESLDLIFKLLSFRPITHNATLEFVWTIVPTFILLAIAVPSIALLYSSDEVLEPVITIKVVGHQWFWSYEYVDPLILEKSVNNNNSNNLVSDKQRFFSFDSYMLNENDLQFGQHRLLQVDNSLVLPTDCHIRVLVTADDVLHSFSVPSLGVKTDAVPGRLNQIAMFIKREGVFYGQCSELCGVNHGFMPISVVSVPLPEWFDWLNFSSPVKQQNANDVRVPSSFINFQRFRGPYFLSNSDGSIRLPVLSSSYFNDISFARDGSLRGYQLFFSYERNRLIKVNFFTPEFMETVNAAIRLEAYKLYPVTPISSIMSTYSTIESETTVVSDLNLESDKPTTVISPDSELKKNNPILEQKPLTNSNIDSNNKSNSVSVSDILSDIREISDNNISEISVRPPKDFPSYPISSTDDSTTNVPDSSVDNSASSSSIPDEQKTDTNDNTTDTSRTIVVVIDESTGKIKPNSLDKLIDKNIDADKDDNKNGVAPSTASIDSGTTTPLSPTAPSSSAADSKEN